MQRHNGFFSRIQVISHDSTTTARTFTEIVRQGCVKTNCRNAITREGGTDTAVAHSPALHVRVRKSACSAYARSSYSYDSTCFSLRMRKNATHRCLCYHTQGGVFDDTVELPARDTTLSRSTSQTRT